MSERQIRNLKLEIRNNLKIQRGNVLNRRRSTTAKHLRNAYRFAPHLLARLEQSPTARPVARRCRISGRAMPRNTTATVAFRGAWAGNPLRDSSDHKA